MTFIVNLCKKSNPKPKNEMIVIADRMKNTQIKKYFSCKRCAEIESSDFFLLFILLLLLLLAQFSMLFGSNKSKSGQTNFFLHSAGAHIKNWRKKVMYKTRNTIVNCFFIQHMQGLIRKDASCISRQLQQCQREQQKARKRKTKIWNYMIESFFIGEKFARNMEQLLLTTAATITKHVCVHFLMETWKAIAVGKFSDNEITLPPVDLSETLRTLLATNVWRAQIGLIVIHYVKLNFHIRAHWSHQHRPGEKRKQINSRQHDRWFYQHLIGGRVLLPFDSWWLIGWYLWTKKMNFWHYITLLNIIGKLLAMIKRKKVILNISQQFRWPLEIQSIDVRKRRSEKKNSNKTRTRADVSIVQIRSKYILIDALKVHSMRCVSVLMRSLSLSSWLRSIAIYYATALIVVNCLDWATIQHAASHPHRQQRLKRTESLEIRICGQWAHCSPALTAS